MDFSLRSLSSVLIWGGTTLGEIEEALREQTTVQEAVLVARAIALPPASVEELVAMLTNLDAAQADVLLASVEEGN